MIRVLLVDDQQLVREGLRRILHPEEGFEIAGECGDGGEVGDAAARSIRVQAPVPGRSVVGIEIPNAKTSLVTLREVLESDACARMASPLKIALEAWSTILGVRCDFPRRCRRRRK